MTRRPALICGFAVCLILSSAQAQENPGLDAYTQRLEDSAVKFQELIRTGRVTETIIDRFANYDIAFPRDADEFKRMNEYAVMLVTAVAYKDSELPLAKIYVSINGANADLPVIARMRRPVAPGSNAYKVFGANREDVFVLVPALLLFTPATLQVDFATNRTGFVLGKGPIGAPKYLADNQSLLTRSAPPQVPPTDVVKALIDREYPGLMAP